MREEGVVVGGASREHYANPRSEGDLGGESGGAVNLVPCAPSPTSLYITGHRGSPTIERLGAPDQGANRSGPDGPLSPLGGEINLTLIRYPSADEVR